MHQANLFDGSDLLAKRMSRRHDPETSKAAAVDLAPKLRAAQQWALEFVQQFPGQTANELGVIAGRPDGAIRKRLRELLRLGLVRYGDSRMDKTTQKICMTWLPTESTP